ncbi:CLUMA_CG017200, isoform A [Clunio marinus]|uniref:CLUMA_CG017200, isoform A n=1 Tax=Clunio marinus TaxID=568069 RepID=A0A1J1IV88_9DIPT|nr:CLUMA_CG017200, isoform A [Clunio marinus]
MESLEKMEKPETLKDEEVQEDESFIPVEFFINNGVRLFNHKNYGDAYENFLSAGKVCPKDATEKLKTSLQNREAQALSFFVYYSWIESEFTSQEAFDTLEFAYEMTTDELLKSFILNCQYEILIKEGVQGLPRRSIDEREEVEETKSSSNSELSMSTEEIENVFEHSKLLQNINVNESKTSNFETKTNNFENLILFAVVGFSALIFYDFFKHLGIL